MAGRPSLGGLASPVSPSSLSRLSRRLLRPTIPCSSSPRPFFHLAAAALRQTSGDFATHTLSTARTLPYGDRDLFRIIADVDAYGDFLPHCTQSRVTHWRSDRPVSGISTVSTASPMSVASSTAPASWPARADLTVGWGPLSQTYSSRVYCIPSYGVVEAVSGRRGVPSLTAEERATIGLGAAEAEAQAEAATEAVRPRSTSSEDDPFESLVTRWTVVPLESSKAPSPTSPTSWSRVELRIRFQFRNPLYQLAAAQVGNEMATKMIEAFESRAERLLGPRQSRL